MSTYRKSYVSCDYCVSTPDVSGRDAADARYLARARGWVRTTRAEGKGSWAQDKVKDMCPACIDLRARVKAGELGVGALLKTTRLPA